MHSLLSKVGFVIALGLAGMTSIACGDDDDGVDTANGKAISDIDIGGDITIDKGATKQVTATVDYADGTKTDVTTSPDLVWNIGDTSVATISTTGLGTGVGVGSTKIHATYQGHAGGDHELIVH